VVQIAILKVTFGLEISKTYTSHLCINNKDIKEIAISLG
jgi:hypothetical protein